MKKEKKIVKNFLVKKKVVGLLETDGIFLKYGSTGLGANTMLFQGDSEQNTLYRGHDSDSTTYFSLSEEVFEKVDKNTSSVRDNFAHKNILFNTMVVANHILETSICKAYFKYITTDILLVLVHKEAPQIDFRKIDYLLEAGNPVHEFISSDILSDEIKEIYRIIEDIKHTREIDEPAGYSGCDFFSYIPVKKGEKTVAKSSELADSLSKPTSATTDTSEKEDDIETILRDTLGSISTSYTNPSYSDDKMWFRHKNTLSKKEYLKVEQYAKQIGSKMKGRFGKDKVSSPSKKIHTKNFIRRVPNIYVKKRDISKGKKINLNIFIDASASMNGKPMKNAVSVALIFEMIANKEKTITGNIILSAGEGSMTIEFGKGKESLLNKLQAFSGEEGIERTITNNMKIMQKADYNICISDANITDDPLNKKKYEARNVFIDGLYINKTTSSKTEKENTEHMEKYFSRGKVIDTLENAVEYISNVVLQK